MLETCRASAARPRTWSLNIAFGEPTIAVDTHIFRVGNRTGLAPGKTPLAVELQLEKRVPKERRLHAHHWLILHGRYVCKARKPDCPACTVRDLCGYKAKTTLEAPVKPAKKAAKKPGAGSRRSGASTRRARALRGSA